MDIYSKNGGFFVVLNFLVTIALLVAVLFVLSENRKQQSSSSGSNSPSSSEFPVPSHVSAENVQSFGNDSEFPFLDDGESFSEVGQFHQSSQSAPKFTPPVIGKSYEVEMNNGATIEGVLVDYCDDFISLQKSKARIGLYRNDMAPQFRPVFFREDYFMYFNDEAKNAAVLAEEKEVISAMNKIRIPEIDFRDVSLPDAVEFLAQQAVEHDPSRRGVRIVLKDRFAPQSGRRMRSDSDSDFALITFSALDITLKDALDYTVDIGKTKYLIIDGSVVVLR